MSISDLSEISESEMSEHRKSEKYMIDITKISAETRWRMMRFAETFDKRQNTLRVIAEPAGLPGSPAGSEIAEREESPFDHEFLECQQALKQCSEPEVRDLLDQMDPGKILEQLGQEHGPLPHTEAVKEKYTAAYHEMKRAEQSVVALSKRCAEYIKHLK
jgi:hypothetical protein